MTLDKESNLIIRECIDKIDRLIDVVEASLFANARLLDLLNIKGEK